MAGVMATQLLQLASASSTAASPATTAASIGVGAAFAVLASVVVVLGAVRFWRLQEGMAWRGVVVGAGVEAWVLGGALATVSFEALLWVLRGLLADWWSAVVGWRSDWRACHRLSGRGRS
jgi:hypothetical protein